MGAPLPMSDISIPDTASALVTILEGDGSGVNFWRPLLSTLTSFALHHSEKVSGSI
jgi:hypothetical protein